MVKITYVPLRNNYRPNGALERQSLSEVKMGRGSPICERVRKKIVEYFKNKVFTSTVHNIIKRFRETGEISVRKVGLLDYDKNHNHDYFGQYCNHDYLTRLLVGHITKKKKKHFMQV